MRSDSCALETSGVYEERGNPSGVKEEKVGEEEGDTDANEEAERKKEKEKKRDRKNKAK